MVPDAGRERGKKKSLSLYEKHQQDATGLTKEERIRQVTDAWRRSDSARAFVRALEELGYVLATGKRPYVLVDLYGEMNALPKLIDDRAVRTKDIRAFLERDFPAESLAERRRGQGAGRAAPPGDRGFQKGAGPGRSRRCLETGSGRAPRHARSRAGGDAGAARRRENRAGQRSSAANGRR